MTSAFTRAAAVLFADANMTVAASYIDPPYFGVGTDCRIRLGEPTQDFAAFGTQARSRASIVVGVSIDAATPKKAGRFTLADGRVLEALGEPSADIERTEWSMECRHVQP